ncbi:hypothetical protein FOBRF1_012052 [Fusarium oxysporum]
MGNDNRVKLDGFNIERLCQILNGGFDVFCGRLEATVNEGRTTYFLLLIHEEVDSTVAYADVDKIRPDFILFTRHIEVDLETSLDPDEIQLYSHILPTIAAGKYKLEVEQTIVFPDQPPEDTRRVLSLNRRFNVQGPKFKLLGNDDILSVHPAPGHAAPNNTLAHVVFTDPSVPWERTVGPAAGGVEFNSTPWLAVLTFTENELLRNKDELSALGDLGPQSHYGTFTALAGKVKAASQQGTITTVMDSVSYGKDYQDSDSLDFITMPTELFQDLFADYTSGQKNWSETPDLRRYSYMAHVREVHGGFMASTTQEKAQIQYGVVVSLRTAPPVVDRETRMIPHLVSLEGLDKLQTNANAKWATLISLHAWHWKCTPPERTSFVDAVAALGKNVQPLRVPDRDLQAFSQPDDPGKSDDSPLAASKRWLVEKLKSGYTLLPHTTITGEKLKALFRGPLCPGIPDNQGVKPWSLLGTDLQVLDAATGMFNLSYSAAWNLSRTLAIADRAFTTSLLRLRGKIHSAAVDRAQRQDIDGPPDIESYLRNLESSLQTVVHSQSTSPLQQTRAINRWYRTAEQKAQTPARRLMDIAAYKEEDYNRQVSNVLDTLNSNAVDSDWTAVRGWVIDQLFLAKVPLNHLVTSAESLPRESVRTFAIDATWVECVVDGALSLANHFSQDDDVIRRAIKEKVNDFLATPIATGPRRGSRPQVPKWGFFLRSMAVTAFSGLKIEVPLPSGSESGLSEVTYMQKLSDDVIICLLDRCPGESTLKSIKITQPGHQQGFSLGNKLTANNIDLQFRFLPNQPGVKLEDIKGDIAVSKSWTDHTVPPIYHWPSHTLLSQEFARQSVLALRQPNIFEWAGDDSNPDPGGVPSSIVASQLSTAILKLGFNVPSYDFSPLLEPSLDYSVKPPRPGIRTLFIPPAEKSPQKASVIALQVSSAKTHEGSGSLPTTRIPLGPRPAPATAAMLQTTDGAPASQDIFHPLPPRRILVHHGFIMECYEARTPGR